MGRISRFFSECALISKEKWSDFDSAIPRFESWRPSQLISLRSPRLPVCNFRRGWEVSWEFFVLLLIFPRLVPIQFYNRVPGNLCISWKVVHRQDRLHVARFVAGD